MSRPGILEITGALVGARLRLRRPVYLVHALTARCNARCGFCAWSPDFYDPRQQLSTEAIRRLYGDARAAGFVGLSIWGGEPLLHRDFDELVAHANGLGLITNMVTNGFLLERHLDPVVAHVDRVCISVDHPSAKHDEIRKIRGLFGRILDATRALRRAAPTKPIVYICTLQKANVDVATVRAMAELLAEERVLGVFNCLREEAATSTSDVSIHDYAPSAEQLAAAYATLGELKREGYPILNSHTHMEMMAAGSLDYRCHWPKFMLPIEANGDVVDCMHWGTRPIANLKETPLAEVLRHPRLRALAGADGERCHKCVSIHRVEISEVCSGNLEPLASWRLLRSPPPRRAVSS